MCLRWKKRNHGSTRCIASSISPTQVGTDWKLMKWKEAAVFSGTGKYPVIVHCTGSHVYFYRNSKTFAQVFCDGGDKKTYFRYEPNNV